MFGENYSVAMSQMYLHLEAIQKNNPARPIAVVKWPLLEERITDDTNKVYARSFVIPLFTSTIISGPAEHFSPYIVEDIRSLSIAEMIMASAEHYLANNLSAGSNLRMFLFQTPELSPKMIRIARFPYPLYEHIETKSGPFDVVRHYGFVPGRDAEPLIKWTNTSDTRMLEYGIPWTEVHKSTIYPIIRDTNNQYSVRLPDPTQKNPAQSPMPTEPNIKTEQRTVYPAYGTPTTDDTDYTENPIKDPYYYYCLGADALGDSNQD